MYENLYYQDPHSSAKGRRERETVREKGRSWLLHLTSRSLNLGSLLGASEWDKEPGGVKLRQAASVRAQLQR